MLTQSHIWLSFDSKCKKYPLSNVQAHNLTAHAFAFALWGSETWLESHLGCYLCYYSSGEYNNKSSLPLHPPISLSLFFFPLFLLLFPEVHLKPGLKLHWLHYTWTSVTRMWYEYVERKHRQKVYFFLMWFSLTVPIISYNSLGNEKGKQRDYERKGNIFSINQTKKPLKQMPLF